MKNYGFFSFREGVEIDDATINQWLDEVRNKLLDGQLRWFIASGDTIVFGARYSHGDGYDFIVATNRGYSKISLYSDEDCMSYIFNFKREEQ